MPNNPIAAFSIHEIGNTYCGPKDRFVISLVVGYGEDDDVKTPAQAASAALELTRDEGAADTQWWVFDRLTGEMTMLQQSEFDEVQRFRDGIADYEEGTDADWPDDPATSRALDRNNDPANLGLHLPYGLEEVNSSTVRACLDKPCEMCHGVGKLQEVDIDYRPLGTGDCLACSGTGKHHVS